MSRDRLAVRSFGALNLRIRRTVVHTQGQSSTHPQGRQAPTTIPVVLVMLWIVSSTPSKNLLAITPSLLTNSRISPEIGTLG
jgi:hypothetical protein